MKTAILPLLTALFLPLLATSQTEATSARRLALTLSPNISHFTAKSSIGDQVPQIGFHARIDGEFRLSNRLWFRAGAGWSLLRFKSDYGNVLQWPSQNNGNGQFDPTAPGEKSYLLQEYKVLTLPVALRYYFGSKQSFYADFETGASLLFGESCNDILRPHVGLGAGWQFNVQKQTWVFIQPAIRLIINTSPALSSATANTMHPYSFGMEIGVRKGL